MPIVVFMSKCSECGSKNTVPTGYHKVVSTSPKVETHEQFTCSDCGFKGFRDS